MKSMTHKGLLAAAALATLSACGGGGTGTTSMAPTPAPRPAIIPGGLNDATVTTAQSVSIFDASGAAAGSFTPSDAEANTSSGILAVLDPDVNFGLGSVSVLNGDTFVFVPATGTAPSSSATYTGHGFLAVVDADNSTTFQGIADAELNLVFGGSSAGTIDFSNFEGTIQVGAATPTGTSMQSLRVNGVVASTSGLTGGTSVTNNTFSDTDFSGASFDVDGVFAGVDYDEVGGLIDITATNGSTIKAAFGAGQ